MPTHETLDTKTETIWRGQKLFGLRGCGVIDGKRYARLQVIVNTPRFEVLLIDIPERSMPYLPDMSPNSQFEMNSGWHYYPAEKGYEIVSRGKEIQRVVLGEDLIYDRDRDGF